MCLVGRLFILFVCLFFGRLGDEPTEDETLQKRLVKGLGERGSRYNECESRKKALEET